MTPWPARETFDVVVVGRRLALVLTIVSAYCVIAGLIVKWYDIRPFELGTASSLINSLILSMLMNFRNSAAYARWWEARSLWGTLINESRNLAAKCAAFVPAHVLARSEMGLLIANFAEALKRQLRDESPRLNELPGFEDKTDDPRHVPLYLAQRVYDDIAEWKRDGNIDQATLWVLDPHARGLLDVCGACEKIRTTPLSPSLKGLMRTGLILNVLAEPWLTVPEVGFWGLPVFLLVCFFLFGVDLIDSIVEEPFGEERDDLNLDRYCRTLRDGVAASLPMTSNSEVGGHMANFVKSAG